jgi:hypothetical protein
MAKAYGKRKTGRRKPQPYAVKFTVLKESAKGNVYTALASCTRFRTKNGMVGKKLASLCLFDGQKDMPVLDGEERRLVGRALGIIKRCDCVQGVDLGCHDGAVHDFGIYRIVKVTDNLCGGAFAYRNCAYFVLPEDGTRAYFNQEYSPFEESPVDG